MSIISRINAFHAAASATLLADDKPVAFPPSQKYLEPVQYYYKFTLAREDTPNLDRLKRAIKTLTLKH